MICKSATCPFMNIRMSKNSYEDTFNRSVISLGCLWKNEGKISFDELALVYLELDSPLPLTFVNLIKSSQMKRCQETGAKKLKIFVHFSMPKNHILWGLNYKTQT